MLDPRDPWSGPAWEEEAPGLRALALAALEREPGSEALRELAIGAVAARGLEGEQADRARAHLRWGLEHKSLGPRWDAVHAAGELDLPDLVEDLRPLLDAGGHPALRSRAAEAFAALAPRAEALAVLEALRNDDDDWTVRRLAGDAAHAIGKGELGPGTRSPGDPGQVFARLQALIRCRRVRLETSTPALEAQALAQEGLRVPRAYLHFQRAVFGGGRLINVPPDAQGDAAEGPSLVLVPPARLLGGARRTPDSLRPYNEYVWERYVEGARTYPKVDEDYALRLYADHYDRGRVDADAWNYGVLLFESAFRDEARRGLYLLRCRDVLRAYKALVAEEWDVVDDRLAEAEDVVAEEGLSYAEGPLERALVLGTWERVVKIAIDLESPGVFAQDPDRAGDDRVAPSLVAFLNAPDLRCWTDLGQDEDPLDSLDACAEHLAAGRRKAAGRLFADVLEEHREAPVLARAAEVLQGGPMTPLLAAQLLSTIPMAGDRKSSETVRAVLKALPAEFALAMIEAVAPYDEDGSQTALFVNAAAGLRGKAYTRVKAAAKQLKSARGTAHLRTIKNPFYKKFDKK